MESKMPQFDALINEVLANLEPHKRICKWSKENPHCEKEFKITEGDIEFLKIHKVPAPNFCPTCRRMRRLSNMNLMRLFKMPCNAPGHNESMISILPPDCPFPVYDYKYYISNQFDAFSLGRKFQEGESPMKQLFDLRKVFPMPSFLNRDPSSINAEYSNGGRNSKNVYYAMATFDSEDVWYSNLVRNSKQIMDGRMIQQSDHVYSSLASDHIYKSSFIYFSKDCIDSMFLFDCRNCDNCFGCVNLRGGKYKVFNEQYTKEEYEKFMRSVYPLTKKKISEYDKKFWDLVKSLPVNAPRNISTENVNGVLLTDTRNVYDVTDAERSEHLRHVDGCYGNHDSMDLLFSGGGSNTIYGSTNVGSKASGIKFSTSSKFSSDSEFIFNCNNVHNCFMCFGIRDKSYCVLNIQYSPEEYFSMVDKIKTEMMKRGEYGDGLGMEFSAQAYNFSMGQINFALKDEEIIRLGGFVGQETDTNTGGIKVLHYSDVPETIDKVEDDIINYAIKCEETGKPFRITKSELQFYRTMKLPIPSQGPTTRIYKRMSLVPIAKKYTAKCAKCSKLMESLLDPKSEYILYCEKCYQQEVY